MTRLSIIVVSYKCRDLLAQCLDSIFRDPFASEIEVIVVDNASNDGSVELVRQRFPLVRVIANGQNLGFPAANNQALPLVNGSSVLLLNPDTIVEPGALATLLDFLECEPAPKIVGLNVRNMDGTPQHSMRLELPSAAEFILEQTDLPGALGIGNGAVPPALLTAHDPQRVATVSGAALAFNRPVIDRIGVFDEDMFWAEDIDFCFRAAAAGIPVFYLPSARILHYGGQSGKRNYRRMLYAQHASRIVFANRHYGTGAGLLLRSLLTLLLPGKIAVRAAQLSQPSRRAESRDRLAGYWDALKFCVGGSRTQLHS